MDASPAATRLLLQTADAVVRDCRSLAVLGWPLELLVRCVVGVEELTDLAAAQQREPLRATAMALYAFLVGIEEIAQPTPAHALELARLAEALAAETADGDRGAACIDLLCATPPPAALQAAFAAAGFALRHHTEARQLAEASRRQPPAALLVEASRVAATCTLFDTLARELPACAATVVFAVGERSGRLEALLQGAEDHAESLDDPDLAARVLERVAPEKEAPYRVLVVDDDVNARHWLRLVLGQAGMQVEECVDAESVAAALAAELPDLLLVDLYLPGVDGLSLTMQLRRQPALDAMPILLVSGEEDERARFRAIEAGADEYLRKPVRPRVLLGEVRSRIRRARRVRRQAPAASPAQRRHGQLRRGDFLAQMAAALQAPARGWQVLMSLKVDQAAGLGQRLGQAVAYELEQAIAGRFAACLAPDDAYTLWLEFGFGILARRERSEQLLELAQALCAQVAAAPFEVNGEALALTLSIGLAQPPAGAAAGNPDRWFAAAFAGMSIAHRLGGNRCDGLLGEALGDMPAERALIIREFVKEAARGEHILTEYQPMLTLRGEPGGLYAQVTKLRDFRAPLAGIRRDEYLDSARSAGALAMIERTAVFNAYAAIREEAERGRQTRILVPMDVASLDAGQLAWLASEQRRRRGDARRLIVELAAADLLAHPDPAALMQSLRALDLSLSLADPSGSLSRVEALSALPGDLLRLPHAALATVSATAFAQLIAPWRQGQRGLIVDGVPSLDTVSLLWDLGVDHVQGDALAAAGPRLDYDFVQVGG